MEKRFGGASRGTRRSPASLLYISKNIPDLSGAGESVSGPLLELDELSWDQDGCPRTLKPRHLLVEAGTKAVVLAKDAADADAFGDVLIGQDWPTRGRIRISNDDVTRLASRERGIALVPAGGGLLPHLSIEQNIGFGIPSRHPEDSWKKRVKYTAGQLNLHGFLDCRPHDLSPDERLRVALARAMCRWPTAKIVVVEDRTGHPPCHAAVSESLKAYPDLPVLVVTDDRHRVETLHTSATAWEIVDADES
ncbi:ATP-binding cassette domain-containing protein [Streptosporangium sp. NPDC051022]|uniref:ATP-binding cassette domain-containing protein n=1 Tax=Streptosporangium sp. NPDC051022 TaxID=3155752 RepID=UPI00343AD63B